MNETQIRNLVLGRVKGIKRNRPKNLSYKIVKVNRGWFKKGSDLNKGVNNPRYGKEPWNKGLKRIHLSPKTEFQKEETVGNKNFKWKGNEVGYFGVHSWIERNLGKPNKCEKCGIEKGKFHWHNINGKYLRNLTDWRRLCPKCHKKEHI